MRSPACAFQLYEVWHNSRVSDVEFRMRVRVYVLPCAAELETLARRAEYVKHWRSVLEVEKAEFDEMGQDSVSEETWRQHRVKTQFKTELDGLLYRLVDTLQPRTWDDFLKYGFEDLDASGGSLA